jgi:hypothetical protein
MSSGLNPEGCFLIITKFMKIVHEEKSSITNLGKYSCQSETVSEERNYFFYTILNFFHCNSEIVWLLQRFSLFSDTAESWMHNLLVLKS